MRLIDADALKDKALLLDLGLDDVEAVVVSDIDNAPTVDPVKHGHWVNVQNQYCVCSVCGDVQYRFIRVVKVDCKFCPNCGTKLDEEVSE